MDSLEAISRDYHALGLRERVQNIACMHLVDIPVTIRYLSSRSRTETSIFLELDFGNEIATYVSQLQGLIARLARLRNRQPAFVDPEWGSTTMLSEMRSGMNTRRAFEIAWDAFVVRAYGCGKWFDHYVTTYEAPFDWGDVCSAFRAHRAQLHASRTPSPLFPQQAPTHSSWSQRIAFGEPRSRSVDQRKLDQLGIPFSSSPAPCKNERSTSSQQPRHEAVDGIGRSHQHDARVFRARDRTVLGEDVKLIESLEDRPDAKDGSAHGAHSDREIASACTRSSSRVFSEKDQSDAEAESPRAHGMQTRDEAVHTVSSDTSDNVDPPCPPQEDAYAGTQPVLESDLEPPFGDDETSLARARSDTERAPMCAQPFPFHAPKHPAQYDCKGASLRARGALDASGLAIARSAYAQDSLHPVDKSAQARFNRNEVFASDIPHIRHAKHASSLTTSDQPISVSNAEEPLDSQALDDDHNSGGCNGNSHVPAPPNYEDASAPAQPILAQDSFSYYSNQPPGFPHADKDTALKEARGDSTQAFLYAPHACRQPTRALDYGSGPKGVQCNSNCASFCARVSGVLQAVLGMSPSPFHAASGKDGSTPSSTHKLRARRAPALSAPRQDDLGLVHSPADVSAGGQSSLARASACNVLSVRRAQSTPGSHTINHPVGPSNTSDGTALEDESCGSNYASSYGLESDTDVSPVSSTSTQLTRTSGAYIPSVSLPDSPPAQPICARDTLSRTKTNLRVQACGAQCNDDDTSMKVQRNFKCAPRLVAQNPYVLVPATNLRIRASNTDSSNMSLAAPARFPDSLDTISSDYNRATDLRRNLDAVISLDDDDFLLEQEYAGRITGWISRFQHFICRLARLKNQRPFIINVMSVYSTLLTELKEGARSREGSEATWDALAGRVYVAPLLAKNFCLERRQQRAGRMSPTPTRVAGSQRFASGDPLLQSAGKQNLSQTGSPVSSKPAPCKSNVRTSVVGKLQRLRAAGSSVTRDDSSVSAPPVCSQNAPSYASAQFIDTWDANAHRTGEVPHARPNFKDTSTHASLPVHATEGFICVHNEEATPFKSDDQCDLKDERARLTQASDDPTPAHLQRTTAMSVAFDPNKVSVSASDLGVRVGICQPSTTALASVIAPHDANHQAVAISENMPGRGTDKKAENKFESNGHKFTRPRLPARRALPILSEPTDNSLLWHRMGVGTSAPRLPHSHRAPHWRPFPRQSRTPLSPSGFGSRSDNDSCFYPRLTAKTSKSKSRRLSKDIVKPGGRCCTLRRRSNVFQPGSRAKAFHLERRRHRTARTVLNPTALTNMPTRVSGSHRVASGDPHSQPVAQQKLDQSGIPISSSSAPCKSERASSTELSWCKSVIRASRDVFLRVSDPKNLQPLQAAGSFVVRPIRDRPGASAPPVCVQDVPSCAIDSPQTQVRTRLLHTQDSMLLREATHRHGTGTSAASVWRSQDVSDLDAGDQHIDVFNTVAHSLASKDQECKMDHWQESLHAQDSGALLQVPATVQPAHACRRCRHGVYSGPVTSAICAFVWRD
ncbi:hypothetical protein PLICRDRAFT_32888 [Plicaturopsis crispa FD-325 SS-3]|uniref:Uncharacterized protein n=1 Tax=Plicaturopsis crispa FD-325 SS-3 TaxID=944288 RepID=A0A0C9T2S5_PLICR|nr:hypothetical protein PLICRDRAFT_32888 [Plicaturopsis crispa FD-325 SS-3]